MAEIIRATAPWICIRPFGQARTNWIEMNVADEGEEVGLFFTKYRLVAILKEMARAPVSSVEVLGVPREQFSHDGGYTLPAASKQQVNVVVHQHPCINGTISFQDVLPEPFKEFGFILVVFEYLRFVNPPHHDMVQRSGNVQSCLAWHGTSVGARQTLVKRNAT